MLQRPKGGLAFLALALFSKAWGDPTADMPRLVDLTPEMRRAILDLGVPPPLWDLLKTSRIVSVRYVSLDLWLPWDRGVAIYLFGDERIYDAVRRRFRPERGWRVRFSPLTQMDSYESAAAWFSVSRFFKRFEPSKPALRSGFRELPSNKHFKQTEGQGLSSVLLVLVDKTRPARRQIDVRSSFYQDVANGPPMFVWDRVSLPTAPRGAYPNLEQEVGGEPSRKLRQDRIRCP